MPGNIILGGAGNTEYSVVTPTTYGSGSSTYYGNYADIYPNQYYKFSNLSVINITLVGANTQLYQEYMFEFTASGDDTRFTLKANFDLYWSRPIEIKAGRRYQISVVNQIVLWTGVDEV